MLKLLKLPITLTALALIASPALADLSYNANHDKEAADMHSVDSVGLTMQYTCGKHQLILTASAIADDQEGRRALVNAKVLSGNIVHNVGDVLSLAVSKDDLLTRGLTVSCNSEFGSFKINFAPSQLGISDPDPGKFIYIFSDGTVEA